MPLLLLFNAPFKYNPNLRCPCLLISKQTKFFDQFVLRVMKRSADYWLLNRPFYLDITIKNKWVSVMAICLCSSNATCLSGSSLVVMVSWFNMYSRTRVLLPLWVWGHLLIVTINEKLLEINQIIHCVFFLSVMQNVWCIINNNCSCWPFHQWVFVEPLLSWEKRQFSVQFVLIWCADNF